MAQRDPYTRPSILLGAASIDMLAERARRRVVGADQMRPTAATTPTQVDDTSAPNAISTMLPRQPAPEADSDTVLTLTGCGPLL